MKAKKLPRTLFTAISFLLMASFSVTAQTNVNLGGIAIDRDAAVEVAADTLEVDQASGKAVFSGNVVVVQGDLKVSADKVDVVYVEATGDISRLLATGGVTFVTADEEAEAESAEYDLSAGQLTLIGNVLLTQSVSAISADRMVINLSDGSAVMEGRVRTVLQQGGN